MQAEKSAMNLPFQKTQICRLSSEVPHRPSRTHRPPLGGPLPLGHRLQQSIILKAAKNAEINREGLLSHTQAAEFIKNKDEMTEVDIQTPAAVCYTRATIIQPEQKMKRS